MQKGNKLLYLLLIGFFIRVLLGFNYDTGDTGAFCEASRRYLAGDEVYAAEDIHFSGPPFALHVTAVSNKIAMITGLPCSGMWKMPTIIADIGIAYLIFLIAHGTLKKSKKKSIEMMNWYLFNPIAIFVAGFHGQQESFWMFFILLSWYVIHRWNSYLFAALFAGIGFAYKLPAILLLPFLFLLEKGIVRKFLFTVIVSIVFVVSLFPEIITSQEALMRQSFEYSSQFGVWGFSRFLVIENLDTYLKGAIAITLIGISGKALFQSKQLHKKNELFFKYATYVIAAFYVFTPGFGVQYLLWILPYLILTNHNMLKVYSIVVTIAFLHTYGLGFPPLDWILNTLQKFIYYELDILYPYDLYFPVWFVSIFILLNIRTSHFRLLKDKAFRIAQ